MKILIAEDERVTRRSLARRLQRWGHSVVEAADGAQAWKQFQQERFDIVLTDWDMPEVDGLEVIQHIRGNASGDYTYLIMLTGRSEKSDLVAGMEAGADDFLTKPFDANELRVRLNAGQRIIELERELAAQNLSLSEANARMKRDLDAAAAIQRDLLPRNIPESTGAHFAWHFEPCDELGGDILNVLPLDDRYTAFYLLDVSGHGVPAALLSVTLSRVLGSADSAPSLLLTSDGVASNAVVTSPREVARELNRRFPMSAQQNMYFTLIYAVFDNRELIMRYVVAGHPPPLLARDGAAPTPLEGRGFAIGFFEDADFDEHAIELQPGDRLYFYSDGITEARNADDAMLETDGMIRLIEQSRTRPLDENVAVCVEDLRRWCASVPLGDDVSLLALEVSS